MKRLNKKSWSEIFSDDTRFAYVLTGHEMFIVRQNIIDKDNDFYSQPEPSPDLLKVLIKLGEDWIDNIDADSKPKRTQYMSVGTITNPSVYSLEWESNKGSVEILAVILIRHYEYVASNLHEEARSLAMNSVRLQMNALKAKAIDNTVSLAPDNQFGEIEKALIYTAIRNGVFDPRTRRKPT